VINLDTNTVIAFVSEGSPVCHQLRAFVDNQQLVMVTMNFCESFKLQVAVPSKREQSGF
jgi:hypothetical protein